MLKYQQQYCNSGVRRPVGADMPTSLRHPSLSRRRCGILVGMMLANAIASAAAQAPSPAYAASTPEDSVRAVELARGEALLHADTTALSRMIAPEFMEISRLGQLRPRAVNLREISTGELRLLAVKYDSLAVRIYGDVAILTGIADNAGTVRGFPFAGKIRYTRVFVRRDGRWQAVAMQQTSMQ